MAKVRLEDGRVINFQGTPTQADIDEVVASLDIKPEAPETQAKSIFRPGELVKSILGRGQEEVGAAAQDIQAAQRRQRAGEQSGLRTAGTVLAQGAQAGLSTAFGGALDVASAIIPDFIENPIRKKLGEGFDAFVASEQGQSLVSTLQGISEQIDTLEPKNQQLIQDLADAALTGVDIATAGIGGRITRGGLAEVGARAGAKGEKLIKGAEADAITRTQSQLTDLVRDVSTPAKRAGVATRTEEGGFFKSRTITPNTTEKAIADELIQTPGIKVSRSALFNLNQLVPAIAKEAKALKQSLADSPFIFSRKEATSRLTSQLDELKRTDPDIIGDAEKLADRVFAKMKVFVEAHPGTGIGGLEARQAFDKWVTIKKPKAFEKQDAFNTVVRSARNTINDFLEEKATKTDVKRSLQRQSRLLNAQDVLKLKSGKEASTGFGRAIDRAMTILGRKNQIIQIIAAAAGIGGLGAASTFAPAVAAIGGSVGFAALMVKLLKSPGGRKKLGQILTSIEKTLPNASAAEIPVLLELRDELKAFLDSGELTEE